MRKKNNAYIVISLLMIIGIVGEIKAGLPRSPWGLSAKELQEKSSIICAGTVTEVKSIGTEKINIENEKVKHGGVPFEVEVLEATMEVKLTIKGEDIPETIKIRCHRQFESFIGGIYCENMIIFLNSDGGNYVPADEYGFWIPVSEDALKAPKDATLIDILRTSLKSNDTGIGVSAIWALEELEGEKSKEWIRPLLKSPNELIVGEAIESLARLEGKDSKKLILPLLESPKDYIKGEVLFAFLKLKDYEFFDEAIKFVKKHYRDDYIDLKTLNVAKEIVMQIYQIQDKSLIPKFNKLVLETHPQLRKPSCQVLSQCGDNSSVSSLVNVLINKEEHDVDVLHDCLVGICRITGEPGPGLKDFIKEKDKYIKRWAEWWEKNKDNKEFKEEAEDKSNHKDYPDKDNSDDEPKGQTPEKDNHKK